MNYLLSNRTEKKLESHIKVCGNKDFCRVLMPSEDTKVLEFNQNRKSDKAPSIIYADLESLIKRTDECKKNFEKSSTTKVGEHIPCRHSMSPTLPFHDIENKHDADRGEGCMQKFRKSLREHAVKIINFERKKMITIY